MTTTNNSFTDVQVADEIETEQVKRTGRFLVFFRTEWWETINTRYIGSDLHITTNREIRTIYLNGKPLPAASE